MSNWIGDGSNGSISVEGDVVSVTAEKAGTPFNVRLETASSVRSGLFFFQVTVKEMNANIAVGVVTRQEFLPGWKTKGMFYNGNVTNGSAALITKFGPYVKAGDTIGVQLVYNRDKNELETQFSVNGKHLGNAFCLKGISQDQVFYPCVHCSGSSKFVYAAPAGNPIVAAIEEPVSTDYAGDWKVKTISAGGNDVPLPEGRDIIISFQGSPLAFITAKVCNTIAGPIEIVDQGEGPGAHNIRIGPLRSTKMMPPPELQAVEKVIVDGLPNLANMTIIMGSYLYMTSSGQGYFELTASRYSKTFPVLTKY
jgi:heat shock protein HslJ